MWTNEVYFDGETISGTLINQPNELTNISNGDPVSNPLNQISDWLFSIEGNTYGGFNYSRNAFHDVFAEEREEHDTAWGLHFGDYNDILVVNKQKEQPENLVEHPMSRNMKEEKLIEFLQQHPGELNGQDDAGYTLLHRETISGNLSSVEVLLQMGADKSAKTNHGKTALDFARSIGMGTYNSCSGKK